MIRSRFGKLWRLLIQEVFPFCGGLLFLLSFFLSLVPVAYAIFRGWFILCTGDVDFLPSSLLAFLEMVLGVVF